ncbi:MAG TPA: M61 family peptidase [Bacteroidota bacterium]|nr:M61 family peptidase [Bacteroidota bacterium]
MPSSRTVFLLLICIATPLSQALSGIRLTVDATEAPRRIVHASEVIDVQPGPLTLRYAEWIPGEHGPTGPVVDVVGLHITTEGPDDTVRSIPWRRDLADMYCFRCEVPRGFTSIRVAFDYILSPIARGYSAGANSSPHLVVLSWNTVVLYPSSPRPDSIIVTPSLVLPPGWKIGTALEPERTDGNKVDFKPVTLNMLVDSPVQAGEFVNRIDISAGTGIPHFLDIASDGEAAIEAPPDLVREYQNLVREATALFGAHHYRHYDFLYTLSDQVASFGLEHHQSSDDRVAERTILDPRMRVLRAGLLPHEFVHSWNGKYRRPEGLATGDFTTPMKGDLLWVYEGLTEYLGNLLTARSGLWSQETYREHMAMIAAQLDNRPGRTWRPLQDAADAAQILYESRQDWESYRRTVDYYDEGNLIWLDVDGIIRERTHGSKSMDDFCREFHGGSDTPPLTRPYTFDDVVRTLNDVAPYDWASYLRGRLTSLNPRAPLEGIERAGWRLAYRDTLDALQKDFEEVRRVTDIRYSLGATVNEEGMLIDVIPGTPLAKAGLAPGMTLIAVDGKRYTRYVVRDAIRLAAKATAPMQIIAQNGDYVSTYTIDYHGGERYPYLERITSRPDLLKAIIAPKAGG